MATTYLSKPSEGVLNLTNESTYGFQESYFNPAIDGILMVLSILVVCTNSLVIYMFFTRESLQTKTNGLLVSLAISDFLVGLLGIPMNILCNFFLIYQICFAAQFIYRFVAISTMYHICVVTLERYIYVLYPMKYIHIVTAPRLLKLIASVWLFSIFVAAIQFAWNNPKHYFGETDGNEESRIVKFSLAYNTFCAVFCFLIPLILMAVSYVRMLMVIHRQLKGIHTQNVPRGPPGSQQKTPAATEARAVAIFGSMLTIFTFAWSSWYLSSWNLWQPDLVPISPTVLEIFDVFRFSVSLANPILYTFLKRDFSRALMLLLRRGNLPVNNSFSQRNRFQVPLHSTNSRNSRTLITSVLEQGEGLTRSNSASNATNGMLVNTESRLTVPEKN